MTFAKMGFKYSDDDIDSIIHCKPLAIENVLRILKVKIELYVKHKYEMRGNNYSSPNLSAEIPQSSYQQPAANQAKGNSVAGELPIINKKGASGRKKDNAGSNPLNLRRKRSCHECKLPKWRFGTRTPRKSR